MKPQNNVRIVRKTEWLLSVVEKPSVFGVDTISRSSIMLGMDDKSIELNLMINEGLVGIKFGDETALISWMDALEMATRLVGAAYEAAASIEVDRNLLKKVQLDIFNTVMNELRNDEE